MSRAAAVRRVPPVDQLDRDGERLVLLEHRAVRLVGLGPAILDHTGDWIELAALAAVLAADLGRPEEVDVGALLVEAVAALVDEGLLERRGPERD